jgi:hypothetical protein
MSMQFAPNDPEPTFVVGDRVSRKLGRSGRDWGSIKAVRGDQALVWSYATGKMTWVSMGALERVTPAERERRP